MFKKLTTALAAASIAAAGVFASVPSAQAGTCWYMPYSNSGSSVSGEYCKTSYRVIDGLKVWFVTDGNGLLHRFAFYNDGTVAVRVNGKDTYYEFDRDTDGAYRVYYDNMEFAFLPD